MGVMSMLWAFVLMQEVEVTVVAVPLETLCTYSGYTVLHPL